MFKEYFYSLFLCSRPIIHFFEQYIPLVHTYNPLVTNIIYHQQHYTFNFPWILFAQWSRAIIYLAKGKLLAIILDENTLTELLYALST